MLECLSSSNSLVWRLLQHFGHKIQCLSIHCLILLCFKGNVTGSVLSQHFVVGLAWKGTHSQEQDVEDESKTEYITNWLIFSFHVFDVYHLRSNVSWCSTTHEQIFRFVRELREAEVSNNTLEGPLSSEQNVLWLEISMHDLFAMHFLEPTEYGVDGCFDFLRFEFVLGLYFIIKLSSLQEFHHNIE